MRSLPLLLILWIAQAHALDCKPPALLKQADGKDDTLQSWCEVDGVRDGIFEVVSLKKGLEVRAHYKKGKLDGMFQRFSENNVVLTEGGYADGHMTGEWTRYWNDGKIRDRGEWKDDTPVGKWKIYDSKGELEREGIYTDGKLVFAEKPAEELTSGDRWRIRFGVARTKLDHSGDTGGPALGADRRLFRFGRWFRADLGMRIIPDKKPNNNFYNGSNQNGEKVYSGQLAFSFDLFPNVTDPVAVYIRGGVHFVDFDKPRFVGGFGLRYHFTNKRQNWIPNGLFAEFGGADGDNNNNNSPGPGPGPNNSNNDQGGGHETLFVGALWAFY